MLALIRSGVVCSSLDLTPKAVRTLVRCVMALGVLYNMANRLSNCKGAWKGECRYDLQAMQGSLACSTFQHLELAPFRHWRRSHLLSLSVLASATLPGCPISA